MTHVSPSDYAEISCLIATITYTNDARDAEGWLACWSSEPRAQIERIGVRTVELVGREALRESTRAWSGRDPGQIHQVGLVAVTDDGEGWAKTAHSAILFRMDGSVPRVAAFAHYHDQVIREANAWFMHSRRVRVGYAETDS